MTDEKNGAEPSGASGGYLVFAEFGPLCWRRPLPLREHETLADAILEARQKAATDTGKFGDVGWVVSTHRDGPCLYHSGSACMRPDPDTCTDAVLLAAEVRRLRNVLAADDPSLTDAEREAIEWAARRLNDDPMLPRDRPTAATLRGLLDRLGGER